MDWCIVLMRICACRRQSCPCGIQDEDVIGANGCTSIGAVTLLENQKYNEGISWGVDDLDRRRNFVMERCVIAGRSFGCASCTGMLAPATPLAPLS